MSFFKIVMPNYNNAEWLDKSIGSVLNQTFTDWWLVFVDDVSSDNSVDKASKLLQDKGTVIGYNYKVWNGGARDTGLNYDSYGDWQYTLFLDSDDWFYDPNVLQNLHDFIVERDYPDCVRLPYHVYDDNERDIMLDDSTVENLAKSVFVACWTKCVKSELVQPFPENTLMEDVVQHLAQCDVIKTVEPFTRPVVAYNRKNTKSLSLKANADKNTKWQSSMYRYVADLMDLELKTDVCRAERDKKVQDFIKSIKNS